MLKILLPILFVTLGACQALAQGSDEYNKVEFYGGFSHARVQPHTETFTAFGETLEPCSSAATPLLGANYQTSFCKRRGFNGFNTSITYNFNRYVGIKGDVTGHYKSEKFVDDVGFGPETLDTKVRMYNFLAGVQVKDNRKLNASNRLPTLWLARRVTTSRESIPLLISLPIITLSELNRRTLL